MSRLHVDQEQGRDDLERDLGLRIAALEGRGLGRRLSPPRGIDFCSNDYLGLAGSGVLAARLRQRLADAKEAGEPLLAAPASRLLRGHQGAHARLEERLATYKGMEKALLFPSGYQANLGLLTALVGPGDRVLSDEANHASIIDALRLSRCHKVIYPHLDTEAVEAALSQPHHGGRTFLVTESLFSMDGDIAPLPAYSELAARHGAALVVDEAHATGLFGAVRGSGLVEHFGLEGQVAASVSTFGKALGAAGACVAGSAVLIDYLVQTSRPFIFSTAPALPQVALIEAALDLAVDSARHRVLTLAETLRIALVEAGLPRPPGRGPIVPVQVGANGPALALAEALGARGFDVRAVRPPTVPPGTARLRISVHADHREEDLLHLADALALEWNGLSDPTPGALGRFAAVTAAAGVPS